MKEYQIRFYNINRKDVKIKEDTGKDGVSM
jgi:hypothetical protein